MNEDDLFDDSRLCTRCRHPAEAHGAAVGTDEVRRIFCNSCPPTHIRMMGDEGTENPMPFLIEGPIGAPIPCFEQKHVTRPRANFLPRSPGPDGADRVTFHGVDWRVEEIEQLKHGDEVRGNLEYKYQLYADQEGLCPGCAGRIRFDNMEVDRVVPGADGGGYTVENVQLLCSACNKIKGDRDMEYLKDRRRSQGFPDGSR